MLTASGQQYAINGHILGSQKLGMDFHVHGGQLP